MVRLVNLMPSTTVQLVSMTPEAREQIKALAQHYDCSMSERVRKLIAADYRRTFGPDGNGRQPERGAD